jgi:hypothetical protein
MVIWKTLTVAIPCGTGIAQLKHVPEVTRLGYFGFVFPRESIQSRPGQPSSHQL